MVKAGGIAGDHLKSFIERIESLEVEKKALGDDIRDLYSEAKANGFDTKVMRELVRRRKMDADDLAEREALLDVYMHAIGMLRDTPLGEAGARKLEIVRG